MSDKEKVEVKRDAKGRLLPGYSLNPSGRPKTAKIKAYVAERTNQGKDLVESAISDLQDGRIAPATRHNIRVWLHEIMYGKPHQSNSVEIQNPDPINFVLSDNKGKE